MALLVIAGCGGGSTDIDGNASDVPGDDVAVDTSVDTVHDTSADVEPDPGDDASPDPAEDPADDGPTDPPADWPHDTSLECEAAGGFCSGARWMLCPAGHEPIGLDGLGCEMEGWCCVAAPSSTCTDSGTANCVPGTSCEGCWGDAGGSLACEAGRVCCVDICW
jgi:hypothetical protein